MKLSASRSLVLLCVISLLCTPALTSCKRITYDLTKNEAPTDAPEYTVEVQENISPAEGGVRKP